MEVDTKAVVVMNERTGTVVLGDDVTMKPVTIAHGDLSIKVVKESEMREKVQFVWAEAESWR